MSPTFIVEKESRKHNTLKKKEKNLEYSDLISL